MTQSLFKVHFPQKSSYFFFWLCTLNFPNNMWQSSLNRPITVARKSLWLNFKSVGPWKRFQDLAQLIKHFGLLNWILLSVGLNQHEIALTINWRLFSFSLGHLHHFSCFGYFFRVFLYCRSEAINSGADRLWAGSLVAAWSADVNSFMFTASCKEVTCHPSTGAFTVKGCHLLVAEV